MQSLAKIAAHRKYVKYRTEHYYHTYFIGTASISRGGGPPHNVIVVPYRTNLTVTCLGISRSFFIPTHTNLVVKKNRLSALSSPPSEKLFWVMVGPKTAPKSLLLRKVGNRRKSPMEQRTPVRTPWCIVGEIQPEAPPISVEDVEELPNHQVTVKKTSIFAPIKLRFLKLRDLYKKGHISH